MLNIVEEYQGLIFDMDGTLIDTMPAHLKAWQQTANRFNFPFSGEWIYSLGGMPSYKIVEEINKTYGLTLEPNEVAQYKMQQFTQVENKGEIISSTYDILQYFHGVKKLAVGTGSQRNSAIKLLSDSGLLEKLDTVITATDVENHKPYPDTFSKAAQHLELQPNQCVVFEDTNLGKQAAHAAGMDCIMVEGNTLTFYPCPR